MDLFRIELEVQLSFQLYQLRQHGIGGGDNLGIGLERALDNDHVHEFLGQVDVRLLQGIWMNIPGAAGTGLNRNGRAGINGFAV